MRNKNLMYILSFIVLTYSNIFAVESNNKEYVKNVMNQIKRISNGEKDLSGTGKDLSILLLDAKKNYDLLSAEDKAIIAKYDISESTFDSYYITPDKFFKIFYKTTGADRVPDVDKNDDGDNDYVVQYGEWLMYARQKYVDFGLKMPDIKDSKYYKIFLSTEACNQGVLGYTSPIDYQSSTSRSYIVLRANYGGYTKDSMQRDPATAKITAAHEFQHSIQMAYSNIRTSLTTFIMEGCAVWAEQFVYPDVLDPINYVQNFLNKSNIGINYDSKVEYNPDATGTGPGGFTLFPYGSWIFFRYMTDLYGNDFIKDLYIAGQDNKELDAFNKVLGKYNTNMINSVKDFYTMCITFPDNEKNKPYYFSLGKYFGGGGYYSPYVYGVVNKNLGDAVSYTLRNKYDISGESYYMLNRLGAHYLRFNDKNGGKYTLTPEKAIDSLVLVVCQFRKDANGNNSNDFKIYSANAFGGKAELEVPYDKNYDKNVVLIYKNSERYLINNLSWNSSINSSFYTFDYVPAKSSVEDYYAYDSFTFDKIYPIPSNDKINLKLVSNYEDIYNIYVYDNLGRLIKSQKYNAKSGENQIPLYINELSNGNYIVEIQNKIKSEKLQFIKQ